MLYILWAILNICAYFYFIYLLIIGGKLVRQKLGLVAAIIFVFGLFSFIGVTHDGDDNTKQGSNEVKNWEFHPTDSLDRHYEMHNLIDIDHFPMGQYTLFYTHANVKGGIQRQPISASSWEVGLSVRTRWQPRYIEMHSTANNGKFEYTVYGAVKWYFLGINIYTQEKTYTGLAPAIDQSPYN